MKVTFPAMRGVIGKKQYFSTVMALSEIPHLFKFNDWEQCTPELRAQRVLNKNRIPQMAKYMLDNEDGYLFSSITASYNCDIQFVPAGDNPDLGHVQLELENAEFVINDGQHRCAAIAMALKENPAFGKERISVLLFPMENMDRLQQMFSDLNRFAQKTSKSLDILYDHRDNMSKLSMEVSERVAVFQGMIDKERIILPILSEKLFSLAILYDANKELLGDLEETMPLEEKLNRAVDYWREVTNNIPDWERVKNGELRATTLRQEKINTHTVVMRALGKLGSSLFEEYPNDWKARLSALKKIDWRKSVGNKVNPTWDNICITAGSVVSNRQARAATLAVLRNQLGLSLSPREKQLVKLLASGERKEAIKA